MKLYEVQATEYNGEQEYFQSKLLAAENIDHAWEIARNYFRRWYDDGDEPEDHNTSNPDEFEFISGCIRLRIKSIQETTLDEWIRMQITLHSIAEYKVVSLMYCAAAEYLAEQGRSIFTGPMNGGLWNARILDACIMSKKEGERAAYEFLIRYGDEYASTLSDDKQFQWQEIKNKAAGKFIGNESKTTQITRSTADLLEACKVITSYTTDLLYRLDNQVNLDDVEEIQQAKDAIDKYKPVEKPSTKLRNACQQMLDTLDIGGEQGRQFAEEIAMLKDALKSVPIINDACPKCGAGSDERQFIRRDFLGIEAVHMHYLCKKCGSEIIEEFTLTDVFIDKPTV